jgi:hypothetical protein
LAIAHALQPATVAGFRRPTAGRLPFLVGIVLFLHIARILFDFGDFQKYYEIDFMRHEIGFIRKRPQCRAACGPENIKQ